ncbi:SIR2 family protein, partial [Bacillus cereus]|nr:SIR2 family protein [Bacillus cereus]
NRPFVFTSNDYEEYTKKFSPFVNMVQQSIMETVFVLIGFSGDDPNFERWTTWV